MFLIHIYFIYVSFILQIEELATLVQLTEKMPGCDRDLMLCNLIRGYGRYNKTRFSTHKRGDMSI